MLNSANLLINIENNKDYSNENYIIFAIHCTKTNENNVIIETIEGSEVIFPPGSLLRGAVYHFYLKRMKYDENVDGNYIGYCFKIN